MPLKCTESSSSKVPEEIAMAPEPLALNSNTPPPLIVALVAWPPELTNS